MGTYPTTIPASVPVANAAKLAASGALLQDAPAIIEGAPLLLEELSSARLETKRRQIFQDISGIWDYGVSEDEVSASVIREHAIVSAHVTALFGNRPNTDIMAAIAANTAAIVANTARLDNMEIRRRNRDLSASHNQHCQDSLCPLVKTRDGVGPPLKIPDGKAVSFSGPSAAIGTPFGAPFPATVKGLYELDHLAIAQLSMRANDTFGIVDGDDIHVRRRKFLYFVCLR